MISHIIEFLLIYEIDPFHWCHTSCAQIEISDSNGQGVRNFSQIFSLIVKNLGNVYIVVEAFCYAEIGFTASK